MATGDLKGDLVNNAYSRGRISGLTSSPTSKQKIAALNRLEMMMSMWEDKNIRIGYNLEDNPDINSPHNVDRKHWEAIEASLAVNILSDFGKEPTQGLMRTQKGAYSVLLSSTAPRRQVEYPEKMPLGRGNIYPIDRLDNFYPKTEPLPFDTVYFVIGDIDDFVEHFDSWLDSGDDVSSYTIEVTPPSGLTIVSDSLSTPDVNYRLQAVTSGDYEVKIVATDSTGRVTTRVKTYQVREV
jgi:hypothetical protein